MRLPAYGGHNRHGIARPELPLIGRSWEASFSHFEIKTFRIPYDKHQPVTELDLLEHHIDN